MNALVMVACGACVGLGVLLFVQGVRGNQVLPSFDRFVPQGATREATLVAFAVALVVGVAVFVVTGWPVAAVGTAVMAAMAPRTLGQRSNAVSYVEQTEAIASWTEMIRDNMAGAAGLEQALLATVDLAPEALRADLHRFAARLDRTSFVDALAGLGADLDHPASDMVVVSLLNAARMEARELGPLLSRLAEAIRDDVRMRLRVEVGRTRIRTSARIVIATTIFTVVFMYVFSRDLLAAYDSTFGQLWMCVVVAVFAAGGWLMRMFADIDLPDRFTHRRTASVARVPR